MTGAWRHQAIMQIDADILKIEQKKYRNGNQNTPFVIE